MKDTELLQHKTIYAKRIPFTKKQLYEVLAAEADHYLRDKPDLEFDKLGPSLTNGDGSVTYPLLFKIKYS